MKNRYTINYIVFTPTMDGTRQGRATTSNIAAESKVEACEKVRRQNGDICITAIRKTS